MHQPDKERLAEKMLTKNNAHIISKHYEVIKKTELLGQVFGYYL